MVRQIIFHVGAPKTGSTYLQKRLRANTQILKSRAICYPVLPAFRSIEANAKTITMGMDKTSAGNFSKHFPKVKVDDLKAEKELQRLLALVPRKTERVILSSEKMRLQHARLLRDLIPGNIECKIVLIVRKQDDWLDSYFSQLAKNNNVNTVDQLLSKIVNQGISEYCYPDWLAHYKEWQDNFEDCRVIFYDDKDRPFFQEFTGELGFESDTEFNEIERANMSLSINELAFLTNLPEEMPRREFLRHRSACKHAANGIEAMHVKYSVVSSRHRKFLREQFEDSNTQLSELLGDERYLLRMDAEPGNYIDIDSFRENHEYAEFSLAVASRLAQR